MTKFCCSQPLKHRTLEHPATSCIPALDPLQPRNLEPLHHTLIMVDLPAPSPIAPPATSCTPFP